MSENIRPEICEGCVISKSHGMFVLCILKPIWNEHQCPCTTCLVKVMCMEGGTGCPAFNDFARLQR